MENEKAKFGLPENYKTWSEMIIDYFKQHPNKWRTQKQVRDGLGIKWVKKDHPDYYRYYNLNKEITRLVKSGNLIRAESPAFIRTEVRRINFVYKLAKEMKKPDYRRSIVRRGKDFKTLLNGS